jgi:hypothetical protein
MKLLFALFVSLAVFTGCGKNKTDDSATKKDSTTQNTNSNTTTPQNAGDTKNPVDTSNSGSSSSLINIEYGVSALPPTLKGYNGSIVAMAKWEDKLGANVLFLTETEEQSKDDNRSKELFAYHYTITDKENKLVWKINDFIKESISITDLDKNGIAESTFLYKMSCKGDVSSDAMKLMMHEGEAKYAIRGEMNLVMNGESLQKGKMTVDTAFDKAPKEFLDHAKEQWNKFNTEKIGN